MSKSWAVGLVYFSCGSLGNPEELLVDVDTPEMEDNLLVVEVFLCSPAHG
jgi:hypothetical protein